jgi:carbamoyl-phosphate synthase large subunit
MSKKISILLVSVGNMASPIIQKCIKEYNENYLIIGIDFDENAHGAYFCDFFYVVPKINDACYWDEISKIVVKHNIEIVFTLASRDVLEYSKALKKYNFLRNVTVPAPETAITCNDKLLTYHKLSGLGISPHYEIADSVEVFHKWIKSGIPFIVKPRIGSGATGVKLFNIKKSEIIDDDRRLLMTDNFELENTFGENLLIVEFLPGIEVSVDVFCIHGKLIQYVVRKRLSSVGGATRVGVVVDFPEIEQIAKDVSRELELHLINNIQLRKDNQGSWKILEVNPRIPGGFSLTISAGGNFVHNVLDYFNGREIVKRSISFNTKMIRYWSEIILNN